MTDKPVSETIRETAAAALASLQETLDHQKAFTAQAKLVAEAIKTVALEDAQRREVEAVVEQMNATHRILSELPVYERPELELPYVPQEPRARLAVDIPSDPEQAAVYVARLLTRVDPGQLATALRRIADALDALTSANEDEHERTATEGNPA